MKKLKIFPKTFLYSLAIMLLIVGVAHLILYLLLPQMVIDFVPSEATGNVSLTIAGKYEPAGLMKSAMLRALAAFCNLLCFSLRLGAPISFLRVQHLQSGSFQKR